MSYPSQEKKRKQEDFHNNETLREYKKPHHSYSVRDERNSRNPIDNYPSSGESKTDAVANHYNKRPNQSVQVRMDSKIYFMRNFNNWVKSVLINKYTSHNMNQRSVVLDLCCGKGGDLLKWKDQNIKHIVMADCAKTSVQDARDRYNKGKFPFSATFIVADCFKVKLDDVLPGVCFDYVSCQFSLHYSFDTEQRARQFAYNVSSRLKVGGYFFATLPNAAFLKYRLNFNQTKKIGNDIFSVEYVSKPEQINDKFGAEYIFYLIDAVDHVPEYFVDKTVLIDLLKEYGLELVSCQEFSRFYYEHKTKYFDLLRRMKALKDSETIRPEEWEALEIYMTVAFVKTSNVSKYVPEPTSDGEIITNSNPKFVDENEVIIAS